MAAEHTVLDLFAGHGWGIAVRTLGAREYGVEIMQDAVDSRFLNGLETLYADAWDAHLAEGLDFDTLLASPPCQTFSLAGGGSGRKVLDEILSLVDGGAWKGLAGLRAAAADFEDERTGLVLLPMFYVRKFRPRYVAFEQVPAVLPVWAACETQLRALGYSTWSGLLRSERYGVPQTRKRAILLGRLGTETVSPPPATHSRYHERDNDRMDAGVLPWVSMSSALGHNGFVQRSNYSAGGVVGLTAQERGRTMRSSEAPSVALTSKAHQFVTDGQARRMTIEEVKILQSYPPDFRLAGGIQSQRLQIGNAVPPAMAEAILRHLWGLADPPPTLNDHLNTSKGNN